MKVKRILYSVNETSELIGLARITIYRKIKSGEWPAVRINRRVFLSHSFLEKFIKSNTVLSSNKGVNT